MLVEKKDKTWRTCIDYRKVNERITPNAYPMPHIHSILDRLKASKFVSTLDLTQGYHQCLLTPDSRQITAFTAPGVGLFEYNVLPFGLTDAPAAFQFMMEKVLGDLLYDICFVYLDDLIVIGETFEEHQANLNKVFEALFKAGLKISWEKSKFLMSHVTYLGFVVGQGKISVSHDKVKAVEEFPVPKTKKQIRSFVGLCGWYRRLIPHYSDLTAPLTLLLKKNQPWNWGEAQQKSFENLKSALTTYPVVHCPDFNKQFYIAADASDVGIGGVIYQKEEGIETVVAYCSRTLNPAERNYSVTERECLAVLHSLETFRPYIEGTKVIVYSDHASLVWLKNLKKPSGRLSRWITRLAGFSYQIIHRKGSEMAVPDALSRAPYNTEGSDEEDKVQANCFDLITNNAKDFSQVQDRYYVDLRRKILERPDLYPMFKVANDVVYKLITSKGQVHWRIYVPEDFREELVRLMHGSPLSGHLGVDKTIARVTEQHFWPRMTTDIKYYVVKCPKCQAYKASNRPPVGEMQGFIPQMKPLTAYAIDIVGPLPLTSRRSQYVLTMLDICSKWLICVPLTNATAYNVTWALREKVICQYGFPEIVISDNAKIFKSLIFKKVCEIHGIQHNLIAPYLPSSNNVERYHRTLKDALGIFAGREQRKWDVYLPYLTFAMNTSVSKTTGYTPAFLTFGRELRTGHSLSNSRVGIVQREFDPDAYAVELEESLTEALKLALDRIRSQKAQTAMTYNLRHRRSPYRVNDIVLRRNFPQSNKAEYKAAKLEPKYIGPFVVTEILSPTLVRLSDLKKKDAGMWHVGYLKPFVGDPIPDSAWKETDK